jgi:hypothetical protein
MENKFHIDQLIANIDKVKRELPVLLANQAERHFVSSWQQQGYEGARWKEVKRREPGTPEYKYPKFKGLSRRTNPIGVNTGALRRDANNSIRSQNWDLVKLVSSLGYSSYFNKNRPFMRDSPGLRAKQKTLITSTVNKALKIQ